MTEKEKNNWRNGIVTQIYNNKFFRSYASKICPRLTEEILSELSMSLLSMKIDSLIKYHAQGVLDQYCTTIIYNMVVNPKSPLNKVYSEKHIPIDNIYSDIDSATEENVFISNESLELVEDIKAFISKRALINEEEAYNSSVFYRSYFGGETFQEISDSIGVTKTSVFETVKGVKQIVETKFLKQYTDVRFK
jgi:antitoxin component of RelBE/YafQ-DinJ toxin-antitoxin module